MDWDLDMNADQTHPGTTFSSTTTTTTADFNQSYLSYPLSHISKTNHETGNRIIMPPSALDQLASLSVVYPMLFRIENTAAGLHSHCGVVEFTADEGFVFLPTWMMNNMHLQEGGLVNINNTTLPKGKYIKIQPHETKFTTLSDHKSLLEKTFRDFACLTTGDTIVVNHGDQKYMIDIVETKPSPTILLFETDCEVDFAPPLDYKEPEKKTIEHVKRKSTGDDEDRRISHKKDCKLFPGAGRRLGGKSTDLSMKKLKIEELTTVVDGKLEKKEEIKFKVFAGIGRRVDGQPFVAVSVDETGQPDQSSIVKKKDEGFNVFTGKSYRITMLSFLIVLGLWINGVRRVEVGHDTAEIDIEKVPIGHRGNHTHHSLLSLNKSERACPHFVSQALSSPP
ncbi:hypothetical protein L1987_35926 [Smallanthus sonchifolius]|uniref:Uncharacterized protein n=1 Tax=Smallanthus sonchifolius TaxID=185202 RepID=A0ACB9HC64_9ASTR|nr:hypothetical protein L1987_35926 [Smallanthus sonchifolius]